VLTDRSSPDMVARFEREAMLMARVRHPNVVAILDYGFLEDGSPCIAMELVEGEGLAKRLKTRGALPWPEALRLLGGILSGLEAMHAAGVLHRDLKPGNILIVPGRQDSAKLIDFGIAQPTAADEGRLTRTGMMVGTPAYMAPEQLLAAGLDARTDVYTAGLVLWEMLAGALPYPPNDVQAVMQRLVTPVPPPGIPVDRPPVPPSVLQALSCALSSEPAKRPESARAFSALLHAAIQQAVSGPRPSATAPSRPATPAPLSARRGECGRRRTRLGP